MNKHKILSILSIMLLVLLALTSCNKEEAFLEDILEVGSTSLILPYTAKDTIVDVTANGEFVLDSIDTSSKTGWFSATISGDYKKLTISCTENDSILARTGQIYMTLGDKLRIITITQEKNPNVGGEVKVDIVYSVQPAGGYTVLSISADECDKIPIGATLVFECGDVGSISFLDDTYTQFMGGVPVDGTFSFVWTQAIADITTGGITTALLNDGFTVTAVYASYLQTDVEYNITSEGGFTIFSVSAAECAKISVGTSFVFETNSNLGYITLLGDAPNYDVWAYCAPVNGKASFEWTSDIVDITTSMGGITAGVCRDGFDIANAYYTYVQSDLAYSITSAGGYTILSIPVEECAKIPIGATVVFECPSDAGTITIYDAIYTEIVVGSPTDGIFSFVWTSDIATTFATSGITTAILGGGFDVTAMYCYN